MYKESGSSPESFNVIKFPLISSRLDVSFTFFERLDISISIFFFEHSVKNSDDLKLIKSNFLFSK